MKLNRALLTAKVDAGTRLCIDFGTAISKAAVEFGNRITPLQLGAEAGDQRNLYGIESTLFIAPTDGRLYFGHAAVEKAALQADFKIRRIQSAKQWLSTGQMGDLERTPIEAQFNPLRIPLSQRDVLTLLLGYVTSLAVGQMSRLGRSPYAVRCFTRPMWSDSRNDWVDGIMASALLRAQLLADSIERWQGLKLADAKSLLVEIDELDESHGKGSNVARGILPRHLVSPKGIPEPLAAGMGALARGHQSRSVALVVDVGAGSTDVAVFTTVQPDGATVIARARPEGLPGSLPLAGDYLDECLAGAIWEQFAEKFTARERSHIAGELMQYSRAWKERLFIVAELVPQFAGRQPLKKIGIKDFLARKDVAHFSEELVAFCTDRLEAARKMIDRLCEVSAAYSLNYVDLVATGGGASLPMVGQVERIKLPLRSGGKLTLRRVALRPPRGLSIQVFQQMAVSMGALEDVPVIAGPSKKTSGVFRRITL